MDVKILGTNEVVTLSIIDPSTGVNYVADLIGNNNGYADNPNTGISYNEDTGEYVTSRVNVEWWQDIINDLEAVNDLVAETADKLGVTPADVQAMIDYAYTVDLDMMLPSVSAAIDELF